MHGALNIDKNKKLITQFVCKLRDEYFEPSYSMIEQCLPNKNESTTVLQPKKFRDLNKAKNRKKSTYPPPPPPNYLGWNTSPSKL